MALSRGLQERENKTTICFKLAATGRALCWYCLSDFKEPHSPCGIAYMNSPGPGLCSLCSQGTYTTYTPQCQIVVVTEEICSERPFPETGITSILTSSTDEEVGVSNSQKKIIGYISTYLLKPPFKLHCTTMCPYSDPIH